MPLTPPLQPYLDIPLTPPPKKKTLREIFCIRAWRLKGIARRIQNELNIVSQKTRFIGCKLLSQHNDVHL